MKTTKEMIEEVTKLMTHHLDGGEVESCNICNLSPSEEDWELDNNPSWNFSEKQYRIKQKPKHQEGKYYKCWMDSWKDPRIFLFEDGYFYNGDEQWNVKAFNRIEPLELEQKKYGLWVATDKDGNQYLYTEKPYRADRRWEGRGNLMYTEKKLFPNQTWKDEPIEI